jgi:hypothetical protein
MVLGQASLIIKFTGGYLQMTRALSEEHKEAVKFLFHGALDFMNSRHGEKEVRDYIKGCKGIFIEVKGISISEFNQWVEEWEVKK